MCDEPPCVEDNLIEDEGEDELDCEDIPYTCVRDCSEYAPCFVVEYCMSVSDEPGVCDTLSHSLYNTYQDDCRSIPEECQESCETYYHCFQCHELCEDSCVFGGDNECDDGGFDSMYSACSDGTDCQDCGYRLSTDCSFTGQAFVKDPAKPPSLPYVPDPPSYPFSANSSSPNLPPLLKPPPLKPPPSPKPKPPPSPKPMYPPSPKPMYPSSSKPPPEFYKEPYPPSKPVYPPDLYKDPPSSTPAPNSRCPPPPGFPNHPLINPVFPSPFHTESALQTSHMNTNPVIGISILSSIIVSSVFMWSYIYYKKKTRRAIIHVSNPLASQEMHNGL